MGANGKRLKKLEQQSNINNNDTLPGFVTRNGLERTLEILREFKEMKEKGVEIKPAQNPERGRSYEILMEFMNQSEQSVRKQLARDLGTL